MQILKLNEGFCVGCTEAGEYVIQDSIVFTGKPNKDLYQNLLTRIKDDMIDIAGASIVNYKLVMYTLEYQMPMFRLEDGTMHLFSGEYRFDVFKNTLIDDMDLFVVSNPAIATLPDIMSCLSTGELMHSHATKAIYASDISDDHIKLVKSCTKTKYYKAILDNYSIA